MVSCSMFCRAAPRNLSDYHLRSPFSTTDITNYIIIIVIVEVYLLKLLAVRLHLFLRGENGLYVLCSPLFISTSCLLYINSASLCFAAVLCMFTAAQHRRSTSTGRPIASCMLPESWSKQHVNCAVQFVFIFGFAHTKCIVQKLFSSITLVVCRWALITRLRFVRVCVGNNWNWHVSHQMRWNGILLLLEMSAISRTWSKSCRFRSAALECSCHLVCPSLLST